MKYIEIEKGLLASTFDNDPHKGLKLLQVKRWCDLYDRSLRYMCGEEKLAWVVKILTDPECWQEVDSLEQVKLNRYVVGKKLLALKTEDVENSHLNDFARYKIACLCCLEDEIRAIFEKWKLEHDYEPMKDVVKRLDNSILMIFWSHKMNNQLDELMTKEGLKDCNEDIYGFQCAIYDQSVEALEYFWRKLQLVTDLSIEQKEKLLMEAALHRFSTGEIVDFSLHYLDPSKYSALLKQDFVKHTYHITISKLRDNYFLDSAQKLFKVLTPEDLSQEKYATLIYGALDEIILAPNETVVKAGYEMLSLMWNSPGFDEHRELLSCKLANRHSAVRECVIKLINMNRNAEILSQITTALNKEQMQYLQKVDKEDYDFFVRHKLLHDQTLKHVLLEHDNVTMLGSNASAGSSAYDNELDKENIWE